MADWFVAHLSLIFLVYGLSFLVLGFIVITLPVNDRMLRFSPHMWLLAMFGLAHGVQELLDGEKLHNTSAWLVWSSSALLLLSYLSLLEFGRRCLLAIQDWQWLTASRVYGFVGLGLAVLILSASAVWPGLAAGARYFIGMPGALLTGLMLFFYASRLPERSETDKLAIWLRIAALAFFSYALLTPLLSAADPNLPAWLPTNADFLRAFGIPVQLMRTLCASTIAVAFVAIVRQAGIVGNVDLTKSIMEIEHDQAEHRRMLEEAVALSEDAILLIDSATNRFVECNLATVRMLHAASKYEVLFTHPWQLSPEYQPDGLRSEEKSAAMNALAREKKFNRFEWMHRRLDGEVFPVEVTLTPVQLGKKTVLHVVWRDLTAIKHAEQSLKRYYRALTMLSAGNRTLVRSTDELQLLEAMCRVAVEKGNYRMAWVGYRVDDKQKTVRPVAQAGFEEGYLNQATISWENNEHGNGPTGLAIRTGQTQIVKDTLIDPRFLPWREEAIARGYTSSIGLPLMHQGRAFGVLMLYSGTTDAFDDAELPLLEEMAEDLSYGIMVLRNDTARRRAEDQVDKSYSLLQAALESTADGILVTALSGEVESYNQRFADMFGIPSTALESNLGSKMVGFIAQLVSHPFEFLKKIQSINQIPEAAYRDVFELKDGRTIERTTQPQYLNGQVIGRVCSYRDISNQKRYEQQLTYLANHDALTGLPNRNLLNDRLEQAIAHACRADSLVAVVFFDLDRFKLINDSLGHNNGDLFLKQLAQRLPYCVRVGDTVARMGGDEFVVLLPDLTNEEDAISVARKLLDVIAAPCTIAGRELFSTASIGIALYPRDGDDAATLLKHADAAMYRAKKEGGGNCLQFVTREINDQVARQLNIESELRHALGHNELEVYYQPQYDLREDKVIGAEALLRWRHPQIGMISPAEFIPIAEETGLIIAIGTWVIETVCSHCKAWQAAGLPKTKVAINLSARQLDLADLPATLSRLLEKAGVEAGLLELEITEGMVMKQPGRAVQVLNELKEMGFSIAIDDFGTGYSSLSYLKRFPIDKVKVDRSFVMDLPQDKDDAAITRAVIAMAHELRLRVVAEGVETDEQLEFLRQYGCDVIQGYLTGRPMPEEDFAALLMAQSVATASVGTTIELPFLS